MHLRAHPLVALAFLLLPLGGCTRFLPTGTEDGVSTLQTDRSEYRLVRTDGRVEGDIDFRYTNASGRTLYVPRCHTPDPPHLEKQTGSGWVVAYAPVVLLCWQTPIAIEPGASYVDTLEVRGWVPGRNAAPEFRVPEIPGTYRLVWSLLVSPNPEGPPEHEQIVSNPFQIRE